MSKINVLAPSAGEPVRGLPDDVSRLMMAELDHRVANGLSCAIAQLEIAKLRLTDTAAAAHLGDAISNLRGFAALQRVLSQPTNTAPVDFGKMLEHLCGAMAQFRLLPAGIRISLNADRAMLDAHTAWLLATATAELLTNSAKHGCSPGSEIQVRVRETRRGVVLRVSDWSAARGIPPTRSASSSGAGKGIIDAIAACVPGTITRSATQTGMVVTIRCEADRHKAAHRRATMPSEPS